MNEVEQLKKRIDDSGLNGVETAHIRDDYEPVGAAMIRDICASGEYVQRKVPPGTYDQKWKVFKKSMAPYEGVCICDICVELCRDIIGAARQKRMSSNARANGLPPEATG